MKNSEILEKRHSEQVKKYIFGGLFGGTSGDLDPVAQEYQKAKQYSEELMEEYIALQKEIESKKKQIEQMQDELSSLENFLTVKEESYLNWRNEAKKLANELGIDHH